MMEELAISLHAQLEAYKEMNSESSISNIGLRTNIILLKRQNQLLINQLQDKDKEISGLLNKIKLMDEEGSID